MKLQNTFVQGRLNKDVDERLLPNGQYPHAENIRVANSDGSDAGAIENVKGNESLTSLSLVNGKTIGAYTDDSNEKIYWFVTSTGRDLVLEYDFKNDILNILLDSTNGTLNFNEDFLITGIVKVINDESNDDLLLWTDDLNPPRKINIERAKTYVQNGFVEDDISVIKKPPRYAPTVNLGFSLSGLEENNIENKFLAFAYRYKYLDGEYSALSAFSNYQFSPKIFDLDYQTMENEGMVSQFNNARIFFNTGDERVTDVEIVYKESNSNTVFLIERFNKSQLGWADNTPQVFDFTNSKIYTALPEDELFRRYDNVPLKAKSLELIVDRIVYGNYVEGYDLIDMFDNEVKMDYELSLINIEQDVEEVPITLSVDNSTLTMDFTGIDLVTDSRLSVRFDLRSTVVDDGRFSDTLDLILYQDYTDASELAQDEEFINFIEVIYQNYFIDNYTATPPLDSTVTGGTGITIDSFTTNTITIQSPTIEYTIDNGVDPITVETAEYLFTTNSEVLYGLIAINSSLKTNRSYEVGVVYMDEYGRETTVLTEAENTIFIPQEYSIYQNILQVDIKHYPPEWADRYKLVVKQNKGVYQTIYTNIFYEDGVFRWVKLEGANRNKVREGDTLIVKADLNGYIEDPIQVRVLEVATKEKDFIENNEDADGNEIIEEAGLYMKIKPFGFNMNYNESSFQSFIGGSHLRYPTRTRTSPEFGTFDDLGNFVPYELPAGSTVRIFIKFKARGAIAYSETFDRTYRVNGDYTNVKEWFDTEVEDLGAFGRDYTWDGVSDIGNNIKAGFGQADANNQFSGWGFTDRNDGLEDTSPIVGQRFYAVAHRKGTASRKITTTIRFEIRFSEGTVIFETDPQDLNSDIFYETEQVFDITNGFHTGNTQDQTIAQDAIVEMDFYNCYSQANGAESYRYKDAFSIATDDLGNDITANYLNIDLRPSATAVEGYKRVRRFADLTYSEPYNQNTNVNGLNEFNLARANYKDDVDKRYGFIQKLYSRDTDLVLFQEDKVSKVLYGKDLLLNADGTSNVASIQDVLGQQVTYVGEYGISRNPESFAQRGYQVYFTDVKRGAVMRLSSDGLNEISRVGMRNYFRTLFRDNIDDKRFGAFDQFYDQYVMNDDTTTLSYDESVKGWTSFHSFQPDYMIGMNNEFFTFKNGDLYLHNSDNVLRNTYYGVQYPSKISLMVNQSPSDIKELQAVSLEGNYPWNTSLSAFVDMTSNSIQSSISEIEFIRKEGIWYAFARRNEDIDHFDSKSTYGIGVVQSITSPNIVVTGSSDLLTVGDKIVRGNDLSTIGVIQNVSVSNGVTTLELDTVVGLLIGDFVVGVKNPRYEGGNLRGYVIRMDLDVQQDDKAELFAVNSEIMKSYP